MMNYTLSYYKISAPLNWVFDEDSTPETLFNDLRKYLAEYNCGEQDNIEFDTEEAMIAFYNKVNGCVVSIDVTDSPIGEMAVCYWAEISITDEDGKFYKPQTDRYDRIRIVTPDTLEFDEDVTLTNKLLYIDRKSDAEPYAGIERFE